MKVSIKNSKKKSEIVSACSTKHDDKVSRRAAVNSSEQPEIWTVYYYEDPPETGFKVGSKEEAYELRDELGDDYEASFYDFGVLVDDDPENFILDVPMPDPYPSASTAILGNAEDGEMWYIDKKYRGDSFEAWLRLAYDLRTDDIRGEEDEYQRFYQNYLDACEYSERMDKEERNHFVNGTLQEFDPQDLMDKVMTTGQSLHTHRTFDGKIYFITIFYEDWFGSRGIDNPNTRYWVDIVEEDADGHQERLDIDGRNLLSSEVVELLNDWKNKMLSSTQVMSAIDLNQYNDGYVEICDGEPNFIYDTYQDAKNGVRNSRWGDMMYDLGQHTYEIMLWKDGKLQPVEESTSIKSADYGGAYDIDPKMFWTTDDIVEFGYDVEEKLIAMPDMQKYDLRFTDAYIVDYNRLVVDFEDKDGNSFASNTRIDMRRIRTPRDLIKKYAAAAATEIRNDVEDFYIDQEIDWNYVEE